jgi:acyl-coenzyme A thioesterase PaaI-like protein
MWSTPSVCRIPDDARLRDATAGVGPMTAMNGGLLFSLVDTSSFCVALRNDGAVTVVGAPLARLVCQPAQGYSRA